MGWKNSRQNCSDFASTGINQTRIHKKYAVIKEFLLPIILKEPFSICPTDKEWLFYYGKNLIKL